MPWRFEQRVASRLCVVIAIPIGIAYIIMEVVGAPPLLQICGALALLLALGASVVFEAFAQKIDNARWKRDFAPSWLQFFAFQKTAPTMWFYWFRLAFALGVFSVIVALVHLVMEGPTLDVANTLAGSLLVFVMAGAAGLLTVRRLNRLYASRFVLVPLIVIRLTRVHPPATEDADSDSAG